MQRKVLEQKHSSYDVETWADYCALYKGGKAVRQRSASLLPQNQLEDEGRWQLRRRFLDYRCYLGQIIDYFVSYLRGAPLSWSAKDTKAAPEFYASLKEDADHKGTDMSELICESVTQAMQTGICWWRLSMPRQPKDVDVAKLSKKDYEDAKFGNACIDKLDACDVFDWEMSEDGKKLEYVVTYSKKCVRKSFTAERNTVVERWECFDRTNVTVYQVSYNEKESPPKEIPEIDVYPHGFDEVPILALNFCEKLWVADRISNQILDNLRKASALAWNLYMTCFAQPVFNLSDRENPPTMGVGYGIFLGEKEQMNWAAPPTGHLTVMRDELASSKDEIYRVVNQMAQGVSNNAAAVGRSGLSKAVDAASTGVILTAIGTASSEHIERALDMISRARGEELEFSVDGINSFDAVDPLILTEIAEKAFSPAVDVKSITYQRELKKKIAMTTMPDLAQSVKDKIRAELDVSPMTEPPDPAALGAKPIPEKT